MDVIDRLDLAMKRLKKLKIEIRYEHLEGVPSGLCMIGNRQVLVVDVSMRSMDQLSLFEEVISKIQLKSKSAA